MKICTPGRVAAYQGILKPRCNGGAGCKECWDKYHSEGSFVRRVQWLNMKRRRLTDDDEWQSGKGTRTYAAEKYGETYDD